TGATGLVGSHVAERARQVGLRTRAIVRGSSDTRLLDAWGVEKVDGELIDPESLQKAARGVTLAVHCAAKGGDWVPIGGYRGDNGRGLEHSPNAVEATGTLRRFIHISSLGVYEGRDHHGTDESVEPSTTGMDGYTLTKVEAEQLVMRHVRERKLPATIL